MGFVQVTHKDGRNADITEREVPFYRSLGFELPVGYAPSGDVSTEHVEAAKPALLPAASGTDQRLDLVLDELRGLRADLTPLVAMLDVEVDVDDLTPDPVLEELRGLRADVAKAHGPAATTVGESTEIRGIGTPGPTETASTTTTPEPAPTETPTRRRTSTTSD